MNLALQPTQSINIDSNFSLFLQCFSALARKQQQLTVILKFQSLREDRGGLGRSGQFQWQLVQYQAVYPPLITMTKVSFESLALKGIFKYTNCACAINICNRTFQLDYRMLIIISTIASLSFRHYLSMMKGPFGGKCRGTLKPQHQQHNTRHCDFLKVEHSRSEKDFQDLITY